MCMWTLGCWLYVCVCALCMLVTCMYVHVHITILLVTLDGTACRPSARWFHCQRHFPSLPSSYFHFSTIIVAFVNRLIQISTKLASPNVVFPRNFLLSKTKRPNGLLHVAKHRIHPWHGSHDLPILVKKKCLHKYEFPTYPVQLHFLVNCAQTHFEMRYSSGDVLNLFAAERPQLFHQVHSQKQHF